MQENGGRRFKRQGQALTTQHGYVSQECAMTDELHVSRISVLGMQPVPKLLSELWEIVEKVMSRCLVNKFCYVPFHLQMGSVFRSCCRYRTTSKNNLRLFRSLKRTETVPTVI